MLDNRLKFGPYETPPADVEEEFGFLMSLALDDMLDEEDQAAFDEYLREYPVLADEWDQWQQLDDRLFAVPSVLPSAGFIEEFEVRLLQQERRQRLWWGVGFAVVIVLLSVGIVMGTVSFGAFVVLRQPGWLTQLVHQLAFYSASAVASVNAAQSAATNVLGSDQIRTFGLMYAVASAGLIGMWVAFLRRTTRMSGDGSNQTSAA